MSKLDESGEVRPSSLTQLSSPVLFISCPVIKCIFFDIIIKKIIVLIPIGINGYFFQWKKHWFVLTDAGLKYYRDSNAEEVRSDPAPHSPSPI